MTTQTKPGFTPGPWKIHPPGSFSPTVHNWTITSPIAPDPVTRARYTVLAEVFDHSQSNPVWEYPGSAEDAANARLIAAAPAMYEALKAAIDADNQGQEGTDGQFYPVFGNPLRAIIEQALAQAEGK